MRLLAAAVLAFLFAVPARADILIDNVNGLTPGEKGDIETFNAVLIGDDGRIEQVFNRSDKRPGHVDYRLDGKGRVMIPGLVDSHMRIMDFGLSLLKAKAGFEGTPKGEPRPEDRDVAFAEAQQLLLAQGLTTVADMGTTIEDWQTYRRAGDQGSLRMRVVAYAASTRDMALIGGPGPTPWLYDDRLKQNGLSLVLDGQLETHQAWLKAPYADAPQEQGKPLMGVIQLRNQMSRGAIDNFQVAVTAHGDAATAAVLDAIDELSGTYEGDRRWRIEGLDIVDEADLTRFGQHKIVASVEPWRLSVHRDMADALLGTQRLASVHRWLSLAEHGASLTFGSGAQAEPPRPFAAMAVAITRQDGEAQPFGGWQPQERLTREEAFTALTSGGAHALFAEGRIGRIAAGYRADFLLLDHDPLLAPPRELREMRVLQTWVGGKLAYEAKDGPVEGR